MVLAGLLHALVLAGAIGWWLTRSPIGPPLEVELVVLSDGADAGTQALPDRPSSNDAPVTADSAPLVAPPPPVAPTPVPPAPVPPTSPPPTPVPPPPSEPVAPPPVPPSPAPAPVPAIKPPPSPPPPAPKPAPAPPRPAVPAPSKAPPNLAIPDSTGTPGSPGSAGAGVNGPAGGGDVAVIAAPPPSYPALARRRGEEGRVTVRADIGSDGVPRNVVVEVSSGYASLDQAAVEAVRDWRFRNNSGATVQVAPVIRFELRPDEKR